MRDLAVDKDVAGRSCGSRGVLCGGYGRSSWKVKWKMIYFEAGCSAVLLLKM